ncbi:DUF1707 SHOCT-like domain-containing protein [Blastococcus mobilis]|uniref:DUF1707 domain-containing protein n=1 Tax=Blastococcus mobilis TaxID=1938746 RepID=A0A238XSI5_9ACTN|nr:DUF1707 domain-containing protein [Blastococcus mobilis]SNR61955.1 protein of unknown function [Blastococcus mobilis]
MPDPHLRAADADRAAVAAVLGEHMSAGRLTLDEYDERLARAYAAKTYGELEQLTADLPAAVPAARPAPQPAAPHATSHPATVAAHGGGGGDPHSWRAWATTSLIVLVIWAATSLATWEFLYFWPVWVIGPWGAVLLARTLTGPRHGADVREEPRRLE